ncbi:MAG: VWA domain-containing protein [Chitinivibrionia bacterium]|nr:VWA domain-containing protein [Chitinivibrionia bacterium]
MRFAEPEFLWALLLLPFFVIIYILIATARKNFRKKFGDKEVVQKLLPREIFNFRPLKAVIFLTAFSFLIIALARPLFGVKTEMTERVGVDIMIALDVSKSMLAEDITPNRLRRAQFEIANLFEMFSSDRVGLIIFAGEAFMLMPLTLDYSVARMYLDAVSTDWVATQGTDISGAIELARRSFTPSNASKVLIILSDGEETSGDALRSAQRAAQDGIVIYTVGVGSESGVPIPMRREGGSITYMRDRAGNVVMTRLNPRMLEEIAIAGSGRYFSAGVDLNLTEIYRQIREMEQGEFGATRQARLNEQYQLFLLIALILFFLEFFLIDAIFKKNEWKGRFS